MCPVVVDQCRSCGLLQQRYFLPKEKMFVKYSYRSGVTQTMRDHLKQIAHTAIDMLGVDADGPRISCLDIAGNDGTLLSNIDNSFNVVVDPSDIDNYHPEKVERVRGFFPEIMKSEPVYDRKYDLIFCIAMLYDCLTPNEFVKSVAERLKAGGLFVVEVASQYAVLQNVALDYFVTEHIACYSPYQMDILVRQHGLKIVRIEETASNGGSNCYYICHANDNQWDNNPEWNARKDALIVHGRSLRSSDSVYTQFADNVRLLLERTKRWIMEQPDKSIYVLGASTKVGVLLQAIGSCASRIRLAIDRDPSKAFKVIPGTGIQIMTEENARAYKPDRYLVGPWHFAKELIERERQFLEGGGKMFFPIPNGLVVDASNYRSV